MCQTEKASVHVTIGIVTTTITKLKVSRLVLTAYNALGKSCMCVYGNLTTA